jgi:hypothetical protein
MPCCRKESKLGRILEEDVGGIVWEERASGVKQ